MARPSTPPSAFDLLSALRYPDTDLLPRHRNARRQVFPTSNRHGGTVHLHHRSADQGSTASARCSKISGWPSTREPRSASSAATGPARAPCCASWPWKTRTSSAPPGSPPASPSAMYPRSRGSTSPPTFAATSSKRSLDVRGLLTQQEELGNKMAEALGRRD